MLALGILALILFVWRFADAPRTLAIEVKDRLGLQFVEGHRERIERSARESNVEPALIGAVMYAESRGRGGQTSYAGAHGLMQLVPASAADAARRLGVPTPTVEELRDDDDLNVRLGAAHLRWLLDHRGEWNLEQVLVSYNAGRAKLMRWIDRHGGYPGWRADELAKEEAGEDAVEKATGALRYALQVLEVRRILLERGEFHALPGIEIVD